MYWVDDDGNCVTRPLVLASLFNVCFRCILIVVLNGYLFWLCTLKPEDFYQSGVVFVYVFQNLDIVTNMSSIVMHIVTEIK